MTVADPLQFISAIALLATFGTALIGYAVWGLVIAVTGVDPFAAYPARRRQSRRRAIKRNGGLVFWRVGRLGGSVYIARRVAR